MARKAQFPPRIYHHPSGRDRVRVKGVDYWLGPTGSEEAKREYARLVAELSAGKVVAPKSAASPATVADVVAAWDLEAQQTRSERGRELPAFRLSLAPLLRIYGHTAAAEFDTLRLEVVQRAMASGSWMTAAQKAEALDRGDEIGWCRNVVNRRVVRIRTVWRWAERKKLVPPGSFAHLCSLPGLARTDPSVRQTAAVKPVTWDEVLRFVRVARERRDGGRRAMAMVLLQWWTGMRSCEVRLMRPCDIERSVAKCGEVWVYRPHQHKMEHADQPRVVLLGPKCQALLRPWLAAAPAAELYLFAPGDPQKPYGSDRYAQVVRRIAEAAGLAGFHPYRLRHSARLRITRAINLDAARAILGHRSLSTTNSYAAGVDEQTAADAARRCG